jgi:serpin B
MMMHAPVALHGFRQQGDFVGIDLPFQSDRFSMTVITTLTEPVDAASFVEVADWLNAAGFEEQRIDLAMPRLSLSGGGDVRPALDALGLAEAQTLQDPLGGFGAGISLGPVIQRVAFKADEDGAEAAAVTAATATRSFEGKPLRMVVDKPFVFAIRDRNTGLIMVAGYVENPNGR